MTTIVIGAGSGMGTAAARQLADRGALVLADVNVSGAEALAAELGGDVRVAACDVSDQAQLDALLGSVSYTHLTLPTIYSV